MAKCSSCGADIIWAETMTGKKIPLDAKPEKRIVLVPQRVLEPHPPGGDYDTFAEVKDTYQTHFVSCPNAAQHRKK